MTILDELAARARARVAEAKQHIPFELLKERVAEANASTTHAAAFPFERPYAQTACRLSASASAQAPQKA